MPALSFCAVFGIAGLASVLLLRLLCCFCRFCRFGSHTTPGIGFGCSLRIALVSAELPVKRCVVLFGFFRSAGIVVLWSRLRQSRCRQRGTKNNSGKKFDVGSGHD